MKVLQIGFGGRTYYQYRFEAYSRHVKVQYSSGIWNFLGLLRLLSCRGFKKGPKDPINLRILQTAVSGIPPLFDLGTRMLDPYVYVVFEAPIQQPRSWDMNT